MTESQQHRNDKTSEDPVAATTVSAAPAEATKDVAAEAVKARARCKCWVIP
jgi:hypothetical protein